MADQECSGLSPENDKGYQITCHDLWGDDFRIWHPDKEDQFTAIF